MNFSLWKIAMLCSFSVVHRSLDIADSFVILILSPVKSWVRLKISLLSYGFFQSNLFCFFSFRELFFLFLCQSSILQIFTITSPRSLIISNFFTVFDPRILELLSNLFSILTRSFSIHFIHKFLMPFMNIQTLNLALIPQLLNFTSKDKSLSIEIRISTIPISSKPIHFLIKLMNRDGVLFSLTSQ